MFQFKTSTRRHSYTASFKLTVCKFAEEFGNRAAGRKYGIEEANIRRWRKSSETLQAMPRKKRAMRGGAPHWQEMEERLAQWVRERRARRQAVSVSALRLKGQELAKEMSIEDFAASNSWANRFMKRMKKKPSSK